MTVRVAPITERSSLIVHHLIAEVIYARAWLLFPFQPPSTVAFNAGRHEVGDPCVSVHFLLGGKHRRRHSAGRWFPRQFPR